MISILKSLLLVPTAEKFAQVRAMYPFFEGDDETQDKIWYRIEQYYEESNGELPSAQVLERMLSLENSSDLANAIREWFADESIQMPVDEHFFAHLKQVKTLHIDKKLGECIQQVQAASMMSGTEEERLDAINEAASAMHSLTARAAMEESRRTSLFFGEQAVSKFQEDYRRIRDAKENEDALFYEMGLTGTEELKLKPGDLYIVGGFTSHGKSIWLRNLTYRLLIYYGLNVAFFTLEMSEEVVRRLFYLLHANNRRVFPDAPRIRYKDYREGNLTNDQLMHLEQAVIPDLVGNPSYGTLWLEQPGETRFRMEDLQTRCSHIERTVMELHVLSVDYITLMYPSISDRAQPSTNDYNAMFKVAKRMAVTHRRRNGVKAPILFNTAVQIPRHRLEEAQKNDGKYSIGFAANYSECERSGDVLSTVYLPEELKAASSIRLQHHKNRDGEVPLDPKDYFIDLEAGQQMQELQQRSREETMEALSRINI